MKRFRVPQVTLLFIFLVSATSVFADDEDEKEDKKQQVHPLAIFAFEERGSDVKGMGSQVSDLLFANLVRESRIYISSSVRSWDKILDEQGFESCQV